MPLSICRWDVIASAKWSPVNDTPFIYSGEWQLKLPWLVSVLVVTLTTPMASKEIKPIIHEVGELRQRPTLISICVYLCIWAECRLEPWSKNLLFYYSKMILSICNVPRVFYLSVHKVWIYSARPHCTTDLMVSDGHSSWSVTMHAIWLVAVLLSYLLWPCLAMVSGSCVSEGCMR